MNEDRALFLSTLGLGFCQTGNHATAFAYLYDNVVWCPEHPAPAGLPDSPRSGKCHVGRIHSALAVYWVPVLGLYVCKRHLQTMVYEIIRRGEWGSYK